MTVSEFDFPWSHTVLSSCVCLQVGGSWVEMDANIPSGESIVRQLLYGQSHFQVRPRSVHAHCADASPQRVVTLTLLRHTGTIGIGALLEYRCCADVFSGNVWREIVSVLAARCVAACTRMAAVVAVYLR